MTLKSSPILENADSLHFVHIYNSELKPWYLEISGDSTEFEVIEKYVVKKLDEIKNKVLSGLDVSERTKTHCFFDRNVKIRAIEYIREINADLVIAATHGGHGVEGMFSDSFSNFLVEHSPCDVHIIRPTQSKSN